MSDKYLSDQFKQLQKQVTLQLASDVDESYIKSFLSDSRDYALQTDADNKALTWATATSQQTVDKRNASAKAMKDRATKVRAWLSVNKSKLSPDSYQQHMQYLDDFSGFQDQSADAFKTSKAAFSRFATEEDYNKAVNQQQWQKQYGNMSYKQLQDVISSLPNGDEKTWLETYAPSVMSKADYDVQIADTSWTLDRMNALLKEYQELTRWEQDAAGQAREAAIRSQYGSVTDLQERIEKLKQQKYSLENARKYNFLRDNADYEQLSQYRGEGTSLQETVNDQSAAKTKDTLWGAAKYAPLDPVINTYARIRELWNYENLQHMTNEERSNFNYIYAKEGKDAAKEYMDYLQYALNERATAQSMKKVSDATQSVPFLSQAVGSLLSTPIKLLGGEGLLDAAGQKAITAITGEYKPIDYNRDAMWLTNAGNTIRQTTAQNIMDATGGPIQLDETEHPYLAAMLNGKSWADVYNLGVSMVDSAAVAVATKINPVAGKVAAALLAGSAGTDAMLTAAANGASDEQALTLGVAAGFFEYFFEKHDIEKLLGQGTNVATSMLKQSLTEAVGEGATELANVVTNAYVMAENSDWHRNVDRYLQEHPDWTPEQAKKQAYLDTIGQVLSATAGGAISGGFMGGGAAVFNTLSANSRASKLYGNQASKIVDAVLLQSPDNAYAAKMRQHLDSGKTLNGGQIRKLLGQLQSTATTKTTRSTDSIESMMEGLSPTQAVPQTPQYSTELSDLVDQTIGQLTGAPEAPLDAALEAFRATGTISNKDATHILNNAAAVSRLVQETGMKLPDTASGKRAAVKEAVSQLAQQQAETSGVDSNQNSIYDEENVTGGNEYGGTQRLFGTSEAGLPGGTGTERVRTSDQGAVSIPGRTPGGMETGSTVGSGSLETGSGSSGFEVQLRVSPVLRVSDQLSAAQLAKATPTYAVRDTSTQPQVYEAALISGRESDINNGWCVTPKSAQELSDGNVRTFMNDTGTVGVGVAPDGDIVAVFKNQNGGPKRALDTLMPIAIEQGGDRLDCYGEGLVRVYENYGFVPVARVEFNAEYANEGWTPDKGTPYIYFMMHNGDSAADVTKNIGKYSKYTQEQLDALPTYGKDDYDAAMAYRDSLIDKQKQERNIGQSPSESVGAAPAWFDPNTRLQYEHGTIPEGENPVRPDDLPKRDVNGGKVSFTARTVKGAKVTPDEFIDLLNQKTGEGMFSYVSISNNEVTQKAMDHIMDEGWDAAKIGWQKNVEAGKTGAEMVAVGALLLNNSAKAGAKEEWLEILSDFQAMNTNTAQGLQAIRILKTLEPQDQLFHIKRSLKQMAKDMKLGSDLTIDPELETEYRNAETAQDRNAAISKIQKNIAEQLPSTLMEKWTALRYLNMLGNLRTQGRNIVGNVSMAAVNRIKNSIAAGLETIAYKASGGKFQRTKSLTVSKDLLKAAKADFDSIQSAVMGGTKYGDSRTGANEFMQGIQDQRRIFAFAPLEGYRKATNWAMEAGDKIFSRSAYARALAGYLKANGITGSDFSSIDSDVLDKARAYAIKEAQETTFRDSNFLADWVSTLGRKKTTPKAIKAVSEGIMPFRKTPANVLIRAEEYSPLGIINSLYYSIASLKKGSNITGEQIVNSWAKSLTGTGLFGLGMLLSTLGAISAGEGDDKDKDSFESMNGWQNYAITLPNGWNFTIDCFSPSAIPVLMGAELMEQIRDEGFQLKDFGSALTSVAEPLIQMSMLQGINDTLEDIQYAENNMGQLVLNACLSYLTQGITNTMAGQLERTFEGSRMTTYVDKDSQFDPWLQRWLGKTSAKIPGWDYQQIPYVNAWGEEEENPHWVVNGAYNTLSPSYIEKGISDEVYTELNRLNDAQSDLNIYPSSPDTSISYSGKTHNLSAEEWTALAKAQGQTQKALVEKIISSPTYSALSDVDKAKAIDTAYDYARDSARIEVLSDYPGYSSGWMSDIEGVDAAADAILTRTLAGSLSTSRLSGSDRDVSAIDDAYNALFSLPADTREAVVGELGTGSDAVYVAARGAGVTSETMAYVTDLFNALQPEPERKTVRTIQRLEALTEADSLPDGDLEKLLPLYMSDSTSRRYENALDTGYTSEDFVAAYRVYLDKDAGSTQKQTIREIATELDTTYSSAKKLYTLLTERLPSEE